MGRGITDRVLRGPYKTDQGSILPSTARENYNLGQIVLENAQKHEIVTVIPTESFQCCRKMMKCKLVLDLSVLSTLRRDGEGQNTYRMNFSNPCDKGR